MWRKLAVAALTFSLLGAAPGLAHAVDEAEPQFTPGAPGIGDPYFPLDGNGGYDVRHYDLDLRYDPATDVLSGVATILAQATQDLSSFNLDFQGLQIRSLEVNRRAANWTRTDTELTVIPLRGLPSGRPFVVEVSYDGVPQPIDAFGISGVMATDDGVLVAGQPHVAATWFPANDHPIDKASFTIAVEVPEGLEAISNGVLVDQRSTGGWTDWRWRALEPMATYLAVLAVGEFDVSQYESDGIYYLDAIDPDLFASAEPRTGEQYALSLRTEDGFASYKRLARTISVPADGAQLSFWVTRDTEPEWDFLAVEASPSGTDDWTTLPDLNGHTSQSTGFSCPYWLGLHPFLEHYQTPLDDGTCAPTGTTGEWWAASGASDGYEQWVVDLSPYAGSDVEVSISYISDDFVQGSGVFVDDVVVSTGEGSTSFEEDGDTMDGWTVPGAPAGSAANPNDWIVGTAADAPPSVGEIVEDAFARQPEIIDFLSQVGEYPFRAAGGIVDDFDQLGFALETQTRPIYAEGFFTDPISADSVLVHELAHQWFGDKIAVSRWQHIWLNEGFATYAEWLWSEREGLATAQENYDAFASIPADDSFWELTIGDPGTDQLFDFPVYARGAMTLHALRLEVGDETAFDILRQWVQTAGSHGSTEEFIALAEEVSGQELDAFFDMWLFTPEKPAQLESAARSTTVAPAIARAVQKGLASTALRR